MLDVVNRNILGSKLTEVGLNFKAHEKPSIPFLSFQNQLFFTLQLHLWGDLKSWVFWRYSHISSKIFQLSVWLRVSAIAKKSSLV